MRQQAEILFAKGGDEMSEKKFGRVHCDDESEVMIVIFPNLGK